MPPVETVHIPDGPLEAKTLADGSGTRHVPDGPDESAARRIASARLASQTHHVSDLPRFGRYQALAEIGMGGMAVVFRAHDDVLGRAVAVKALHPQADAGIRERFLREAKAVGAILHPNILAIYDAGTADHTPFLVMELAQGGSLRDRLQAGPLPVDTVREVGIQIARALAAAHAANIIHRDVKPANILSSQANVWKLADFGIARLPDSTLTVTGQFLGSPSYAAPESLSAGQFSAASDVYGLAATLYEALTGSPPHGDHEIKSLVRKLEEDPAPVYALRAVPGPLGDAIMQALSRDPASRPSAADFARMIALTEHEEAPIRPSRTLPVVAIIAALIALIWCGIAVRSRLLAQQAPAPQPSHVVKPIETPRAKPKRSTQPQTQRSPRDENVDEDTARRALDQIERDAREEAERMRKRNRNRNRNRHVDDTNNNEPDNDPWRVDP